jgi:hypothetical protein
MNPMTVIDKLQQMLDLQYEATRDDMIDVPYVDDDEYKTNRSFGEQEEIEEAKDEDEKEDAPPEEDEAAPEEEIPDEGGDELAGAEGDPEDVPPADATTPGDEGGEELAGEEDPADVPAPEEGNPDVPTEEDPTEADPTAGAEDPALAGGEEGGDMAGDMAGAEGGDMGADMGGDMGGMGGEPEPMSPKQVGRAYELKKIYSRMISLEKYLTDSTEPHLIELRGYVSNALDLFRTVTTNFETYKDKADDIIVTFYKFLKEAYTILKKYYKEQLDNEE